MIKEGCSYVIQEKTNQPRGRIHVNGKIITFLLSTIIFIGLLIFCRQRFPGLQKLQSASWCMEFCYGLLSPFRLE